MIPYFGYIRVSTAKQGEHGVSLQEQKEAINRFALSKGFIISRWFEERKTAAKGGRLEFGLMLKELKKGSVKGVIIHKIDRSARNLKDWSNLGELIDSGVDVQFANESLDLHSRGGRLSADIQAVVASDYIRNLREETKKGFYGRIRQGLLPIPAPLGYVDCGKGKPKELDPLRAPLIKKMFELYSTNQYSLRTLTKSMYELGLRNRHGGKVPLNSISIILNNPFYFGLIRLKKTGEVFPGIHTPLIRKTLFERVQNVLKGKLVKRITKHDFLFRKLLQCKHCGYSLIGEKQKGHIYYRCQTRNCPTTTVREEIIEELFISQLQSLIYKPQLRKVLHNTLMKYRSNWIEERDANIKTMELNLEQIKERLNRLTDAFLDRSIEKEYFNDRKNILILKRVEIEEQLENICNQNLNVPDRIQKFLELAESSYLSYISGNLEEKRELVKVITSNRLVDGKYIEFMLDSPFLELKNLAKMRNGVPQRDITRTLMTLMAKLVAHFINNVNDISNSVNVD